MDFLHRRRQIIDYRKQLISDIYWLYFKGPLRR
jgi:hypothetical protein